VPVRRYGLISDTHGALHPEVFTLFDGVEAILHAGDVVGEQLLDELEVLAPVHAVRGNCDYDAPRLPAVRVVDLPLGRVVVAHSHLVDDGLGRPERLARHFAEFLPRVIVFGHTHRQYRREHDGVLVVNPGSAGRPRFGGESSLAFLEWDPERDALAVDFRLLDWSPLRRVR